MKIIQIGVGGFGRHWAGILASSDEVEVVALVDIDQTALTAACEECGYDPGICYLSLDQALGQVEADVLVCVTPPAMHLEHTTAAMQAGLHVICEKPMAGSLEDCVAMLLRSRQTGRKLSISQNYRFHPEMMAIAGLIRQGAIGQIGQIRLDFYKGWPFHKDDFRQSMSYPIIVDMAIHHFDLMRYLTGLEAHIVQATAWNPSWSTNLGDTSAVVQFQMNNDARIVYNASGCAQGDFCDWNGNWLIEGDKGSIVYENNRITLNRTDSRHQVTHTEIVDPPNSPLVGQALLLSKFIEAIQSDSRPPTDVANNLRSIAMVFAAVTAIETGKSIPILTPEMESLLSEEM